MFDLIEKITARGTGFLNGELFDDPTPGSDTHIMRWFPLGLVPKRFSADQGRDYPFTVVGLLGGKDTAKKGLLRVKVVCGLYVNPDTDRDDDVDQDDTTVEAATAAMQSVIDMIRGLAEDCNYAPYSLEEFSWWIGDEEGLHPGPDKYYVSAELVFSQAPIIN